MGIFSTLIDREKEAYLCNVSEDIYKKSLFIFMEREKGSRYYYGTACEKVCIGRIVKRLLQH